jgi:hypothetical protein
VRKFLTRVVVPLVLLAVVGLGVWTAVLALRVNSDLRSALDEATALQDAVRAGDDAAADSALDRMRESVQSAEVSTGNPAWSVLTRVPVVGDDARGVRLVTEVTADLTDNAIAPLVEQSADLDSMVPTEGRVPVEELRDLQGPVAEAAAGFAEADRRLAAEDPSGFVDPLAERYADLTERVAGLADSLATADTAVQLLPTMLGAGERRSYLVIFQNNAEARSLGGLPGAASLLTADGGRLELGEQVQGNSLGEAEEPVLPLTEAEAEIYGPQLGTYFLDANFTPDLPRAAALWQARWEQEYDAIDGVLVVDPVAVSYLLAATGPVAVGGVELRGDNVIDELLNGVYLRFPEPEDQDEFFAAVSRAVFDKIISGGAAPQPVLEALVRGGEERRLLVHSFEPAEQDVLTGTAVAGELFAAPAQTPQVGVYLNDNTGSKMSYYLRSAAAVTSTSCADGVQVIEGTLTLSSVAPPDAATSLPDYVTGGGSFGVAAGKQLVAIRFYAPAGGTVDEVAQDGDAFKDIRIVAHQDREAATSYVLLNPDSSTEMSFRMTSAAGQTGDVALSTTPGVVPGPTTFTAPSSC